jgi:transposase
MNSIALFQLALNLEKPWYVKSVDLTAAGKGSAGELHIYLDFETGGKFKDSAGALCGVHDTSERTWQHLNFFEHVCYLHARVPRIVCSDGRVKQVQLPWSRAESHFTLLFEAYAMMLVESEMPMSKVASALRVVDNRLWRVFKHWVEQAVAKDNLEKVERVGIDETSTKKGHQYVTVCADLDTRRVVYVGEGRGAAIVGSLATTLSQKGGSAAKIRAVAIDMSPAYISGVMEYLPNAAITFDKFHIVSLLNKSLDELRKGEKKQLEFLKGHKYTFLRHYSSLTEEKRNALDVLLVAYPRLGEAYRLREIFYGFWDIRDRLEAESFLVYWCDMVKETDMQPLKNFASTILGHLSGVLNYVESLITSGLMEGINNKIQLAKRRARGYRNINNFINMIYFIAGKLSFGYPHYPS